MLVSWLPLLFAAASACTPLDGWNAGRTGQARAPGCALAEYAEAHKLGAALFELTTERATIETRLPSMNAGEQGPARRRQRQLQNDIEALHGVAVTRGWPYEGKPR